MCGIAGFIDFNKRSSPEILLSCTNILAHRGPDGSGEEFIVETECQVGLGHRRLSIIDLSEGAKQPMVYKHWTLIFNGEIFNYKEIRNELIEAGHSFDTQSDSEVILHSWEEWGVKLIDRFIGMYVFVIYDSKNKKLICFRDRAGIKPLYYYWKDDLFLFASELKSFHQHPSFKKEINGQALHQFFQYGYIMGPLCIFQNAFKLLPGHYLEFDISSKKYSNHKYWDVYDYYNRPKIKISEQEAFEETEKLLISACNYRMVADVPVGVFLSGGYDSTAVTALIQANRTEKLKTFTIGFFEEDHNEAEYAKKVAAYLGTDHTEHYCTSKEAQDIIPDIPFYCDEPFGDSSIIPTTLVSQLARKSVTVALSADAGDEIFAGYPKYPISIDIAGKLNSIPAFLKKTAGNIVNLIPDTVLTAVSGHRAASIKKQRLADILKGERIDATLIMDDLLSKVYSDKQMRKILNHKTDRPASFFDVNGTMNHNMSGIDKMLAIDYKTYMPDDILVKVDRAGMSVSLEGREPLVDFRLVEFMAQLPDHYKMNKSSQKILLKKIVHKYVPKEMMDRPKMGFGVPVHNWLRNELKFYADEFLDEKSFSHGLLNKEGVNHIIRQFFKGDSNYNALFWYLLIFQMWYKKWMN